MAHNGERAASENWQRHRGNREDKIVKPKEGMDALKPPQNVGRSVAATEIERVCEANYLCCAVLCCACVCS